MTSFLNRAPLALLLLVACGPGTSTTDNSSTGGTGTTGPGTSDTTSEPTGPGTSDATIDPTGVTNTDTGPDTSDPTTGATTDATTATTGDPVCPDTFPEDGTPCDVEGQFCGGPCDDPCSFCNVIRCEQGTWMALEVFPANCLDCESICKFVVDAACNNGPPDQDTCVAGCETTQAGDCGIPYNEMLACAGDMPTFTCDEIGRPLVASCETQFTALYACLEG